MPALRISIIMCLTLILSSAAFLSSNSAYASRSTHAGSLAFRNLTSLESPPGSPVNNAGSSALALDGASPTWNVVSSPNTSSNQNNYLLSGGHTCLRSTDCWMVGYYNNGSVNQTLIENYNGTSWTITPSPNQTGTSGATLNNQLNGVACTAIDNCWATGRYVMNTNHTLALHWDGTSWTIVPTPNLATGSVLLGVQCLSASQCYAVGYGRTSPTNPTQALIEAYDGTGWTIAAWTNTLSNTNTAANELLSLSCVDSTHCWAVGWQTLSGVHQTAIVMYDGTNWSVVSPLSPNQTTTTDNELSSISCAGNRASNSNEAAIANAHRMDSRSCLAVGYYKTLGGIYQTLSEYYDGTSWTIIPSVNQNTSYNNQLI